VLRFSSTFFDNVGSSVTSPLGPDPRDCGGNFVWRDLAFLGQIGERALGIARLGEGVAAWRDRMVDGEWKRFYAFGAGKEEIEKILPRLPGTIPA